MQPWALHLPPPPLASERRGSQAALLILFLLLTLILGGCGGGGGGGGGGGATTRLTGRVLWIPTGSAPSPPATVQVGGTAVQTSADGTFRLDVRNGTQLLVVFQPTGGHAVAFSFELPTLAGGQVDFGDLWIGPEKTTVRGRILSAADDRPVEGADVRFGGRRATSAPDGRFTIADVAYSSQDLGVFFGIEGRISRPGFFTRTFFLANEAVGGVVDAGDLLLSPETGGSPPPPPANIFGVVSPADQAPGTEVTLSVGGVPIRRVTVGSDQRYGFWVPPGTYTLSFLKPGNGLGAPDESVTLSSTSDQVRRDVTLR